MISHCPRLRGVWYALADLAIVRRDRKQRAQAIAIVQAEICKAEDWQISQVGDWKA